MAVGSSWWSKKWLRSLEGTAWKEPLPRQTGQVQSIQVEEGQVRAVVEADGQQFEVRLELEPLSPVEWEEVLDAMASRVSMVASLLNRRMPADVEDAFKVSQRTLLPTGEMELEASCTCLETAYPCAHAAAVAIVLAEALDHNPFMMFSLRGMEPEQVLASLLRRWGVSEQPPQPLPRPCSQPEPLPRDPDEFWRETAPLPTIDVGLKKPRLPNALIRRLGVPYRRIDGELFEKVTWDLYTTAGEAAQRVALGE